MPPEKVVIKNVIVGEFSDVHYCNWLRGTLPPVKRELLPARTVAPKGARCSGTSKFGLL